VTYSISKGVTGVSPFLDWVKELAMVLYDVNTRSMCSNRTREPDAWKGNKGSWRENV
jgi:hypothetical protein